MATEDYIKMPIGFKIRKVLRYVELYGINRTLVKVKGQYHMKSEEGFEGGRWDNPKCKNPDAPSRNIGFIGSGAFPFGNLAYYSNKEDKNSVRAAMDLVPERARSLIAKYNGAYATTNADDIINDPKIDLVFVVSNHASHAPYAVKALDAGKDVHIEKPHVVTEQQLDDLEAAMKRNPKGKVFLGFNRPRSKLFHRLQEELRKEDGSLMINWFVAGHEINDDHWYFKESEGGRILGNLCHWSDLTLELVGIENAFPARIVPTANSGAQSDFVTSIEFADGSLASITFSAKGHTFEGVREILNVHKGNILADLKDFKSMTINRGSERIKKVSRFRDHGHRANVVNSIDCSRGKSSSGPADPYYTIATAKLFLAISQAHRERKEIWIEK